MRRRKGPRAILSWCWRGLLSLIGGLLLLGIPGPGGLGPAFPGSFSFGVVPTKIGWVGPPPVWAQTPEAALEQVVLRVEGMECRSCVKAIRKALLRLPGVHKASVVFRKKGQPGKAIVWVEPGRVSDATLVQTIEAQSNLFYTYKAEVLERELLSNQ